MYKALALPVISYSLETATINNKEEEDLKKIKRMIMRIILGPNITDEA